MPYFQSCECPPGHMGYPGTDPLCCTPKRFAASGFGATGSARHFAPARPVAPTEYTTLEREAARRGMGQSVDTSQYVTQAGSIQADTHTQYVLPSTTTLVDTATPAPTGLAALSRNEWLLIGAGAVIVAAGIYAITRTT